MIRTILVTVCENTVTKVRRPFYGRYDPVTLDRGNWKPISTEKVKYSMTDETFAKYGKKLSDKKEA